MLELRWRLTAVFGSHSGGTPDGQFCRSRIGVVNHDPEAHNWRRTAIANESGFASPPV